MGLSFKIISMSSSISVPSFMLLPQNPQFCHYFTPFCWTKPVTIKTLNSEVFWSLAHTKWLSRRSKRSCRIQVDFGYILTFTISSNRSFSDNLGQNSWDKSQNCTTSVFDSVPPAPPVSVLVESNAIRPSQH